MQSAVQVGVVIAQPMIKSAEQVEQDIKSSGEALRIR